VNIEDLVYQAQTTASSMAKSSLSSHTSVSSLVVLYFAGLLTSFSPCSLGLLPLTISYISSAAGEREDKGTFIPTLAFAAGLAFVFCSLGLSVSLLGGVLGANSGPGSLFLTILSSVVSISMGLQLLDLLKIPLPSFDFQLPTFLENGDLGEGPSSELVFDDEGNLLPQGTVGGASVSRTSQGGEIGAVFRVFLLGGSSALVASPCSTPVLTSILGFLAATRDPAVGAILLLTYTIGYSTPLLIVGATGGQALANAQAAASANESSVLGKIGKYVNPLVAGILIFYGCTAILEGLLGDPSLVGLDPILE
jgi:cytochrome c-type biogenesis protein